MKNRKLLISVLAGIMAAVMLLSLIVSILPTFASAASSSEIRKQINQLKQEKEELKGKIAEVQAQYEQNTDEIRDLIAKKAVIDQEVQLLHEQLDNINQQIKSYNTLIADKQDELDTAQTRYSTLNSENKDRIRTMEEEGSLSYWEVLFRANNFSDLLDRLNIVEEIAVSDNRRLKELGEAADAVSMAKTELQEEKSGLDEVKQELNDTQVELDLKQQQALDLLQQLLQHADELEALEEEYNAQEEEFLKLIAQKEVEYDEAKQAEWEAYMATYVPPTTAPPANQGGSDASGGSDGNSSNGGGAPIIDTSGGWLVPCSYTSITSPFGMRTSPTAGASTYHQGVDLDSTTGVPVVASRAGIVTISGFSNSAGNYVQIDHQDGFRSIYMHLNSRSVGSGQIVSAGQMIGTVGATGIATGDHLHFGISLNGVYVNPCSYVPLG